MVRTVPTGRGSEIAEVVPEQCPDCGRRPMWPYHTGCDGTVGPGPGHRYWLCESCRLELIDADCNCTTPGRRWPAGQAD